MKKTLKNQMVVLGAVILFTCMTMVFIGCVPRTIPVPEDKPRQESKIISPEDFNELIVGKTKIEVKEIMGGPPDQVMQNFETNDPSGHWGYMKYFQGRKNITAKGRVIYDPITSKDPNMLIIIFKNDVVEKTMINY